jgi:5-methylcytosine-specific restriction endonuclease McrA
MASLTWWRQFLFDREGGKCFYCDQPVRMWWNGRATPRDGATIDHIIPKSRRGILAEGNVVLACFACNTARGDIPAVDYLFMARRDADHAD